MQILRTPVNFYQARIGATVASDDDGFVELDEKAKVILAAKPEELFSFGETGISVSPQNFEKLVDETTVLVRHVGILVLDDNEALSQNLKALEKDLATIKAGGSATYCPRTARFLRKRLTVNDLVALQELGLGTYLSPIDLRVRQILASLLLTQDPKLSQKQIELVPNKEAFPEEIRGLRALELSRDNLHERMAITLSQTMRFLGEINKDGEFTDNEGFKNLRDRCSWGSEGPGYIENPDFGSIIRTEAVKFLLPELREKSPLYVEPFIRAINNLLTASGTEYIAA